MPYTEKQHRLFQAAAHNPAIAKKAGISQADAKKWPPKEPKKLRGIAS